MSDGPIAALIAAETRKRDKSGRVPERARQRIAKLKADALCECIRGENIMIDLGKLRVEIEAAPPPRGAGGDTLCYRLRIIGAKGRVVHEDLHVVYNPPIMVEDGTDENGEPVLVEDPRRALMQIALGQARKALGL